MLEHELLNKLANIKKGRMFRITYLSEPSLRADAKKLGYKIQKKTTATVRYGVKYANIKRVQSREAARTEPKIERAPWWHWKIPQVIQEHNTKEKLYLQVATLPKHSNSHSVYIVTDPNGAISMYSREEVQRLDIVQPSYWNSSSPEVISIEIGNIVADKENKDVERMKARSLAVHDAHDKASVYANAAGYVLGDLISISDSFPSSSYGTTRLYAMAEASAPLSDSLEYYPGDISISDEVHVVYSLSR